MADPSLVRFRKVVTAALAELERRREEVNLLNVFPVADGDTGDNMALTMRAVLDELDALGDNLPVDQLGREELVSVVARAALLGARGNSGVILSQIVRGAAEELASRPGELIDPVLVSAAFARAADAAYDAVRDPVEGTMLSAVRAMAHQVAQDIAHLEGARLDDDATDEQQDRLLAAVLERALGAAQKAVERGPEQLAVLREAGVVDAGAYGLTVIIAGVIAALRGGEDAPEVPHQAPPVDSLHVAGHEASEFRFCTNFAVEGQGLEGRRFVPALEALGDCVLVVGDERTLRVHLHTDEPERATAVFAGLGAVSRLEVADMEAQVADRDERLAAISGGAGARARAGGGAPAQPPAAAPAALCGAVAVANGPGLARLMRELGAVVVDGGASMNPSTAELLSGIRAAAADEVLLLPNNPNVRLAADRAAELAERPVTVVPTRSPQAGLALLVSLDPTRPAAENAALMAAAAEGLRTGGVAEAARDDAQGRFRAGDAVGYAGEDLVAHGDPYSTLAAVIGRLAQGAEIVTCLAGEDAPLGRGAVEAATPGEVELEYHEGGQPAWWWLLSAE